MFTLDYIIDLNARGIQGRENTCAEAFGLLGLLCFLYPFTVELNFGINLNKILKLLLFEMHSLCNRLILFRELLKEFFVILNKTSYEDLRKK